MVPVVSVRFEPKHEGLGRLTLQSAKVLVFGLECSLFLSASVTSLLTNPLRLCKTLGCLCGSRSTTEVELAKPRNARRANGLVEIPGGSPTLLLVPGHVYLRCTTEIEQPRLWHFKSAFAIEA
jgi:hypothetical protein